MNAILVYQAGIANVFHVEKVTTEPEDRQARRLIQSDFRSCEMFCLGMEAAGVKITSMGCNMPGYVKNRVWTEDLDSLPFSTEFRPVFSR